jgi:tetratricopeptide (TPR) repeat protein
MQEAKRSKNNNNLFLRKGKEFAIYLLFFFSNFAYSQDVLVEKIKKISSPTKTIIFVDSLLFHNSDLNKKTIDEVKYLQALAYQENNNHRKALEIFAKVLHNVDKKKRRYIKILLFQSNSNVKLENISLATEQALKAIEQAKINNDTGLIAAANNALSFIYYSNKQYDKAFDYLSNSVEQQKQEKDSIRLSATYNNIAIIYKKIGDYKSALEYNYKSLEISEQINNLVGVGKSYSNIGRVYQLLKDNNQALTYYEKALNNNKRAKIVNSIPYRNIADVYFENKQYIKSELYLSEALKIENTNKNNPALAKIYETLLKLSLQQN